MKTNQNTDNATARPQFKLVIDRVMDDGITPIGWTVKQLMPRRLGGDRAYWVNCWSFGNLKEAQDYLAKQIAQHGEFFIQGVAV
jgi:hypothetical protein